MITTYIGVIQFGFSLLFGVALSVCYAGIERTRKNNLAVVYSCVLLLFVQSSCWWLFGIDLTSKLYPLIIHLPLILLLTMYLKRPWAISIVSVLSAYLCCQVPRWIGIFGGAVFRSSLVEHICYIAAVFLAYYLFQRYVAGTLRQLMETSTKYCVMLGAVPLFYYLFDYITTIYTDWLYRGIDGAVQFMPSLFSIVYFAFIILYHVKMQKQVHAQRERDMLAAQLHGAHSELVSLRQMQNVAAAYRHDMHHHFAILQGMTSEGSIEKIKTYLNIAQSDIDAITPIRFCENETVNLILSTFFTKAKHVGITMTVDAKLPSSIPLSDTELCSLLSNGLENAIFAVARLTSEHKVISFKAMVHKANLLILIENPYAGVIVMKGGLPQSSLEGHGYGTHNISAIADAHGGQAIFSSENGVFSLKIMLPLRK
ncbi:ATP-binding protein [Ruminiclostridium cellulolyticum]|uniref:Signal transduction histidine kinase regulating citrate/malate metabolism n=1 Tax=Ruminiclostridium cellulolyticum (strain ATCC 35319 / DSM 5812 / JCM 6584 / H10) TaxID=394503 RepID=B8I6X9_RUMCH|nr:ATP-binding protein [Ruminiclostridium cellulolyticum]ACL76971.1 signal transduction histidine kinase regulating citrate/malate metabolism [Ruminiclostridium cellulolyticum H10]